METLSEISSFIGLPLANFEQEKGSAVLTPVSSPYFKPFKFGSVDNIRSNFIRNEFFNREATTTSPDNQVPSTDKRLTPKHESKQTNHNKIVIKTEPCSLASKAPQLENKTELTDITETKVSPRKRPRFFSDKGFSSRKKISTQDEPNKSSIINRKPSISFGAQKITLAPKLSDTSADNKNADINEYKIPKIRTQLSENQDYKGKDTHKLASVEAPNNPIYSCAKSTLSKESHLKANKAKLKVDFNALSQITQTTEANYISDPLVTRKNLRKVKTQPLAEIVSEKANSVPKATTRSPKKGIAQESAEIYENIKPLNQRKYNSSKTYSVKDEIDRVITALRDQCCVLGKDVLLEVNSLVYARQDMEAQILALNNEIYIIKSQKEHLSKANLSGNNKIKELHTQVSRLESSLESTYNILEGFKKEIKNEKEKTAKVEAEIKSLSNQLTELNIVKDGMMEMERATAQAHTAEIEELKKAITSAENEVHRHKVTEEIKDSELLEMARQLGEEQSKVSELNGKSRKIEADLNEISAQLAKEKELNVKRSKSIKMLEDQIINLETLKNDTYALLSQKNAEIVKLSNDRTELQSKAADYQNVSSNRLAEINKLGEARANLEAELYELRKEYNDRTNLFRFNEERNLSEICALTSLKNQLEDELNTKTIEISNASQKTKNLEVDIAKLRNNNSFLINQLSVKKNEISKCEKQTSICFKCSKPFIIDALANDQDKTVNYTRSENNKSEKGKGSKEKNMEQGSSDTRIDCVKHTNLFSSKKITEELPQKVKHAPRQGTEEMNTNDVFSLHPPIGKPLSQEYILNEYKGFKLNTDTESALEVWVDDLLELYASSQLENTEIETAPGTLDTDVLQLGISHRSEKAKNVYSRNNDPKDNQISISSNTNFFSRKNSQDIAVSENTETSKQLKAKTILPDLSGTKERSDFLDKWFPENTDTKLANTGAYNDANASKRVKKVYATRSARQKQSSIRTSRKKG